MNCDRETAPQKQVASKQSWATNFGDWEPLIAVTRNNTSDEAYDTGIPFPNS